MRPRPGRAVVWLLAALWLVMERVGHRLLNVLEAYERGADAAGRAVLRGWRALLRVLGPLGRLVRRLLTPPLRLLRRVWQWLNVQVLLRMFRPLGRLARAVVDRLRPLVARLSDWGVRLVARLEPVLQRLAALTEAVEAAAARLAARLRRLFAPVERVLVRLRRSVRA